MRRIFSLARSGPLPLAAGVAVAMFFVVALAQAATTISTNVDTGGTLAVTGLSSLANASTTSHVSIAGALWVGRNATTTAAGAISTQSTLDGTGATTLTGTTTVGTAARFAVGTTTAISGAGLLVEDQVGTTTAAFSAAAASKGARLILEDHDGAGCTEVVALNGVLTAKIATCPTGI